MKPKDVNIVFGTPSGHLTYSKLTLEELERGVKYVQS